MQTSIAIVTFIATGKKQQQRLSRELFAFSAAQNQFTDDKVSNLYFFFLRVASRLFYKKTCEESSSARLSGLFTQHKILSSLFTLIEEERVEIAVNRQTMSLAKKHKLIILENCVWLLSALFTLS